MPRGGYSLYDRYQLSNSNAIPTYNGGNGQEAIKVGQYMQGLYDQNLGTALSVNQADDGLQGHPSDTAVVNQTKQYYKDQLHKLATSGDWENMLPQTQQLAGAFARDAQAINSIAAARQEGFKRYDDKELNLTADQQESLKAISDYKYAHSENKLQRDGAGKLVGKYEAVTPSKNLDVNKWVRENAKDIVANKFGNEFYQGTNGDWLTKTGQKITSVDAKRIRGVINDAMQNSEDFKAHVKQQGDIMEYHARGYNDPSKVSDTDPFKKDAIKLSKETGHPFSTTYPTVVRNATERGIRNRASDIAVGTYAFTDRENTIDMSANAVTAAKKAKEIDGSGIVTDTLDNPALKYDTPEAMVQAKKDASGLIESSGQAVKIAENTARAWYDKKNGIGAFDKADKDKIIKDYYNSVPNGGASLYGNYMKHKGIVNQAQETVASVDGINDHVKNYVFRKEFGMSPEDFNSKAREDVMKAIPETGTVSVLVDGMYKKLSAKDLKGKLDNAELTGVDNVGSNGSIIFKDKTSKNIVLQSSNMNGKLEGVVNSYGSFSGRYDDAKNKYGKEALENYSQSTTIGVTNNPKLNNLMKRTVQAGEKTFYDLTGKKIDPKDAATLQAQIDAGNFEYIGTYAENKGNQNALTKVAVKDEKGVPLGTYRIGLKATSSNAIANTFMKEAVNSDGTIKDVQLYNTANAMMPESSYNKINRTKTGIIATVKDKDGNVLYKAEKSNSDGTPTISVVDKDGNLLPQLSDQLNLGSFLDQYRKAGSNYKVEFK